MAKTPILPPVSSNGSEPGVQSASKASASAATDAKAAPERVSLEEMQRLVSAARYKKAEGQSDQNSVRIFGQQWFVLGPEMVPGAKPKNWRQLARAAVETKNVKLLEAMSTWSEVSALFAPKTPAPSKGLGENEAEPLFCLAARQPDKAVLKAALMLGCDPREKTRLGETALMLVAQHEGDRRDHAIECAGPVSRVSDVDAQDHEGETALMKAVRALNWHIVKILAPISNVNLQAHFGSTALHFAVGAKSEQILSYLSKYVDASLRDSDGCTALDCAIRDAQWKMADILISALSPKEAAAQIARINAALFPRSQPLLEASALADEAERGREVARAKETGRGAAGAVAENVLSSEQAPSRARRV